MSSEAARRRGPWLRWLAAAAALAVLAVLGGPRPSRLPDAATGDAQLAGRVRSVLGPRPGTGALAVAVVADDRVRIAGLGHARDGRAVGPDTAFEIGSVTKALTGMLLADRVEAGVVDLDDRLGDVAGPPVAATDAAGIELVALAQHRSGLPRLALEASTIVRSVVAQLRGGNPYGGWTSGRVLAAVADESQDPDATFSYSNLGAAALGIALGRADGDGYAVALGRRVLAPLGMTSTVVATGPSQLPVDRATGTTVSGPTRDPWFGSGYAAAGVGVWSTAADVARLLDGVADGSAPGAAAARPRHRIDDRARIGLGWITERVDVDGDAHDVVWHNGATGGFTSWVGIDRTTGRGVAVLSASTARVDALGRHLLGVAPAPRALEPPGPAGWLPVPLIALASWLAVRAARRARRGGLADRLAGAQALADPVVLLAAAWVLGAWLVAPWWLWSVAAAAVGLCAVVVAGAVRGAPWRGDRSTASLVGGVAQVALAPALVVLLLV